MNLLKILVLFWLLLNPASSNDSGSLKLLELLLMSVLKLHKIDAETSAFKQPGIDQNFEDKTMKPWVDCSENGTNWVIENASVLSNESSQCHIKPPPTDESGTHYLWLKQDLETFGIGILSSPVFLAYPGDQLKFSFWIHSSIKIFNNLQVFWSPVHRKEEQKLLELFPASTNAENAKWRHLITRIPAYTPTEGELIIYGFCEPKDGRGIIAIDNISLIRLPQVSRPTIADTTVFPYSDLTTEETEVSDSFDASTSLSTKEMISSALTTDLSFSTLPPISEGTCPFDTTCGCRKTNFNVYDVNCTLIPTNQIREQVFQKLEYYSSELGEFVLNPPYNDSIPFDMFASSISYVNWFNMDCSNIENEFDVDPFALSPFTIIANMYCHHCNFANLTFLSQPLAINDLFFENVKNFKNVWNTFPVDCNVKILRITKSFLLDLTQNDFPPHSTGLTELRVFENEHINDTIVDMISSWALQFSRDSLANFYVFNNGLKKIPTGLSRFSRLAFFRIDNNVLEPGIVKKGELRFSDYTRLVYLRFCGIHTIEAGAFGGIYEMANVYLDGNSLTRFESGVYQDILSQMALLGDLEDGGFVNVEGSTVNLKTRHFYWFKFSSKLVMPLDPFDCIEDPCHLTWLLRDNNRRFLPFVWDAACANGTLFEDIQPDDPMFKECP